MMKNRSSLRKRLAVFEAIVNLPRFPIIQLSFPHLLLHIDHTRLRRKLSGGAAVSNAYLRVDLDIPIIMEQPTDSSQ